MKKFRFRLQKVMEFKEDAEKQRKLALGEANKRVFKEEEKLRTLQNQDRDYRKRISEKETMNQIDPAEMNLYYRYLVSLGDKMEFQNTIILNAKKEAEKKRQRLLAATKERKILEKLKEKMLLDFTAGLSRKEQLLLDDLAGIQYARRRMER